MKCRTRTGILMRRWQQCSCRMPTATHWKWFSDPCMWKGWFRLRNKDCHDGQKSQSRIWWIPSMYSFFLSKLNSCVIAIVTGEMGGGNAENIFLQYCNDYSIPWQEKDTICNINYGQPSFPLCLKFLPVSFFILSPIPPPFFFFLSSSAFWFPGFLFSPSLSFSFLLAFLMSVCLHVKLGAQDCI